MVLHSTPTNMRIDLNDLGNLIDGLWCVGGDFNEILYSSDRKGSTRMNAYSKRFHNWVSWLLLDDLPLRNLRLTWSNFRVNASCSKLGRIFVSNDWQELYPKVYLKGLPRPVSDHSLLLLATEDLQGDPTPFRFENMWLQHKSFKKMISSWWNHNQIHGWAAYRSLQKLQFIKQNLKIWNKDVFGSLTQQKATLSQQIERLDQEESALELLEKDLLLRNKLKRGASNIFYKEEISWQQKSRLNWLKRGDANTSFFHKVANGRKARNK